VSTGYGASGYGPTGDGMRVGNAEREATASELREHYASGRLTLEELNERLEAAFAARTRADLTAVLRDLPSAAAYGPSGAGAGTPWPGQPWGGNFGGGSRGGGAGGAGSGPRGGPFAAFIPAVIGISMLTFFGLLALGGVFGGGRPIGIGLLIAALALLKRLIFGRRVRGGCGRRSRRR
jgi:DUF1707 SHOCT-like domain